VVRPLNFNRAGLALGSNLGDRLAHLREARELLRQVAVPSAPSLQAPIYQTEPVGCPAGSPDFFNTVVEIGFAGTPFELLDHTQAIERQLGRRATPERNAPRVIDVDILYFGDQSVDAGLLVLPHPRITTRRFVLQPLAAIRPELVLPGDTVTVHEHLLLLDSSEPPLTLVQADW
jgi:2-amino-4-hydroxy-6-hydroxymethyldihydropteridine diphosphokinase